MKTHTVWNKGEYIVMLLRSRYHHELADQQQRLLQLAEAVEHAVRNALWAFAHHSLGEAQRTIAEERLIAELSNAIEEHALRMLACQHPLAGDLRTISTSIILATELKRISDYVRAIATATLLLTPAPVDTPTVLLDQMAPQARTMLQKAIRAVANRDVTAADQLRQADVTMDCLYQQVRQHILTTMSLHPEYSEWAAQLLWTAHYLERIADRSVAIAERAAFIVTGARLPRRRRAVRPQA